MQSASLQDGAMKAKLRFVGGASAIEVSSGGMIFIEEHAVGRTRSFGNPCSYGAGKIMTGDDTNPSRMDCYRMVP